MGNKLLTTKDVEALLCISKPRLARLRRTDPDFPEPIMLGTTKLRYRESDIETYLSAVQSRTA